VSSTALSNRISALQTMGTEEGKNLVLSVTLTDGNNEKYLIKLSEADKLTATAKESISKEKISSWELERLGTALSIGDNPLPLGVALKISH
jgi:tRNA threonylcarbamoyladenosine modification (KEOPS) complex Cgi121 subunit